eukprot:1000320_1
MAQNWYNAPNQYYNSSGNTYSSPPNTSSNSSAANTQGQSWNNQTYTQSQPNIHTATNKNNNFGTNKSSHAQQQTLPNLNTQQQGSYPYSKFAQAQPINNTNQWQNYYNQYGQSAPSLNNAVGANSSNKAPFNKQGQSGQSKYAANNIANYSTLQSELQKAFPPPPPPSKDNNTKTTKKPNIPKSAPSQSAANQYKSFPWTGGAKTTETHGNNNAQQPKNNAQNNWYMAQMQQQQMYNKNTANDSTSSDEDGSTSYETDSDDSDDSDDSSDEDEDTEDVYGHYVNANAPTTAPTTGYAASGAYPPYKAAVAYSMAQAQAPFIKAAAPNTVPPPPPPPGPPAAKSTTNINKAAILQSATSNTVGMDANDEEPWSTPQGGPAAASAADIPSMVPLQAAGILDTSKPLNITAMSNHVNQKYFSRDSESSGNEGGQKAASHSTQGSEGVPVTTTGGLQMTQKEKEEYEEYIRKHNKRKKRKKKQPTPQRCVLLITSDTVALTDPHKDGKPVLMFPRNTITDFKFNSNTDTHFDQYKLEISVWIKDKTHELCIEFPTDDAEHQRDIFIKHFTTDKAKPIDDYHDHTAPIKSQPHKPLTLPQASSNNTNSSASVPKPQPQQPSLPTRRGVKRKHESIMNEETLRQRACKLAKHKYLATLYKTLVGKDVLSPNEFWNEYGKDIDIKHTSNGLIQGLPNTVLSNTMQRESWSLFSLFKDDIDNQQNEQLTIHLTAEKILEIFLHLPEVKLAYQRHVPCHFSEDEFWKAFLQSHYFKRGTTRNVTSGISDKETQIDKLLKTYTVELEQERNQINEAKSGTTDGNIHTRHKQNDMNSFAKQLAAIQLAKNKEVNVQGKLKQMREEIAASRAAKNGENPQRDVTQLNNIEIETTDVEMKDNHNKKQVMIEERHFQKKLHTLDPSIDLTATMGSFTEIIEDPGTDENIRRDDIETWMTQINKHGTMLLYQSLNQNNTLPKQDIQEIMSDVPKVNFGREYKTELVFGDDETNNSNKMGYDDRLRMETELDDLKTQRAAKCIELKIKDQSVYWGDDLLLTEKEQTRMNQEANELNNYFTKVADKKAPISGLQVRSLIQSKFVDQSIVSNTKNNAATGNAQMASHRMSQNKKNEYNNEKEVLMIYGQKRDIKANPRILTQLTAFQKPMTELVRHYWNCFPANKQRLKKAETLVTSLKEYKGRLVTFQDTLAKKKQEVLKVQTVLLQELIDLANKVLQHHKKTHKLLEKKEANRKAKEAIV